MTRQEFLDQVLSPLGRLTAQERENVRRELEEHVEDRMEALLEMGWSAELAEERCLEAMGDPAEIGREMARQYRGRGWLWIGRAAVALTVVVCIQAALGIGMLGSLWDSIYARTVYVPKGWPHELEVLEASEAVDIRIPIKNDVVRVARVNVGRRHEWDSQHCVELVLYSYDRVPGGVVSGGLLDGLFVETQGGKQVLEIDYSSNTRDHYMWGRTVKHVNAEPGDSHVTLVYRQFGENIRVQVPLPEERIE